MGRYFSVGVYNPSLLKIRFIKHPLYKMRVLVIVIFKIPDLFKVLLVKGGDS